MPSKAMMNLAVIVIQVFVVGCAGPKFMSHSSGPHEILAPVPSCDSISLRMKYNTQFDSILTDILRKELLKEQLYSFIRVIPYDGNITTRLLIQMYIFDTGALSWGTRAMQHLSESSFGVQGRLVDQRENRTIITFSKRRSAQGGLLGRGGLATPTEESMAQQLVEWVVDDIVDVIKEGRTKTFK